MMAGIGWEDVAFAFVPQGATLTFEYDEGEEWRMDGGEPPVVAQLRRSVDVGVTANYGKILHGTDAEDVREFLEDLADPRLVGLVESDDEFGEAERAVYRDWSLIARALLDDD